MQSDEMIWQIINHQFCSYKATIGKAKSDKIMFCRHPYSVTGLCNRSSCPLANSRYATLREESPGRIYLCVKTAERAHSPKNLWEKILLSRNYSKALQQIDEHLAYFPVSILHRNKQRLTKIHQYLIRMRKLELRARSGRKAKMVRVHRKIEQREERREKKALVAAKLERNIEKELVERLANGTYGDIYNFPAAPYQKALDQVAAAADDEEEEDDTLVTDSEAETVEYVEDLESDEEEEIEDMDYLGNNEWGAASVDDEDDDDDDGSSNDSEEEDDDDDVDDDDDSKPRKRAAKKLPKKKKTGPKIEIEYEEERDANPSAQVASNW
jgi:protein MAK16